MAACWVEMIEAAVDKQGCFVCPFVLGSDGVYSQYAMYPARGRAFDMWDGQDQVPKKTGL